MRSEDLVSALEGIESSLDLFSKTFEEQVYDEKIPRYISPVGKLCSLKVVGLLEDEYSEFAEYKTLLFEVPIGIFQELFGDYLIIQQYEIKTNSDCLPDNFSLSYFQIYKYPLLRRPPYEELISLHSRSLETIKEREKEVLKFKKQREQERAAYIKETKPWQNKPYIKTDED